MTLELYVLRETASGLGFHYQVQLAMHCANKTNCKFVVWTPNKKHICPIQQGLGHRKGLSPEECIFWAFTASNIFKNSTQSDESARTTGLGKVIWFLFIYFKLHLEQSHSLNSAVISRKTHLFTL